MTTPPEVGVPDKIQDGVHRILAPNPSPMTHWGTNTYVVGSGDRVAVIDPGTDAPAHIDAILRAVDPAKVGWILITHAHRDHTKGAPALAKATGAEVYGFGPPTAGRSAVMQALADQGLTGGGEGVDLSFAPDRILGHGDKITGPDFALTALWTPGHFSGHLAFQMGNALFTGDLVMDWASTLISPPDGDLSAFMASCRALLELDLGRGYPGHGAPIPDLPARIRWLIKHRLRREEEILEALSQGPKTSRDITSLVYSDVSPDLLPAAERNVLAHLIDLYEQNRVAADPILSVNARFSNRTTPA